MGCVYSRGRGDARERGRAVNDFYSLTFRTARKEHKCGCFLAPSSKDPHHYRKHTIRKGQKYAVIAQVWEGSFSTTKLCLTHHALINAIFDVSDDADDEGVDYARAREHYEQMDTRDQKEILVKMREIHRELKVEK